MLRALVPGHTPDQIPDRTNVPLVGDYRSALAAYSRYGPASVEESGGLRCGIAGSLYWSDADLARLAKEVSPAAAVLRAFKESGKGFLQKLHGPFCVAVLDGDSGTGLLAIDRLGIQTLCYWAGAGLFVFGSTADVVVSHPAIAREVDPQGIFNYLYFHMVPSPGTIYRDVRKLLPGQYLELGPRGMATGFYWEIEYQDHNREPFAHLAAEFKALLRSSVGRAIDLKPAGAFLSGGTDSSTVAGVLTQTLGSSADTYSIGFAAEGFDEMAYARIASSHFGTRAHEYYVTPQDVLDAVPLIAQAFDEPFGNESAVPAYYGARMAQADGIKLLLAGDGGDEIFGGNARYAKQKLFELYGHIPAALRNHLIEPYLLDPRRAERLAPLRKLKSYVEQAKTPLPQRLESYNFLHRTPLACIFEPGFLEAIDPRAPGEILHEVYWRTRSASFVNRMLHLDLQITLADNDLRKVSRMCELAGVAVRYPLLDEDMVAFAARLRPSCKVRGFTLRYFFKQALGDFLPREIILKTKHGFGLPFGLWLQSYSPLRELAYDTVHAFARRGYVQPRYASELIERHRAGEAPSYYGVMLWVLMMLDQWLESRCL